MTPSRITELLSRPTMRPTDAGELLGLSRNGVYDAIKRGEIETIKVGRCLKVVTMALRRKLGMGNDSTIVRSGFGKDISLTTAAQQLSLQRSVDKNAQRYSANEYWRGEISKAMDALDAAKDVLERLNTQ